MRESDFLTEEVSADLRGRTSGFVLGGGLYICDVSGRPTVVGNPGNYTVHADVILRLGGPPSPNEAEMLEQVKQDRPCVLVVGYPMMEPKIIAWGDYLLNDPLMDRPFLHGVTDCYEAIRAWKWQNEKLKYGPIPRDQNWFQVGLDGAAVNPRTFHLNKNLYLRNFKYQGLTEYVPSDPTKLDVLKMTPSLPRVGDVILMQIDSRVVNHAGIIVGPNKVYHQMIARPSGYSPLQGIMRRNYIKKWLRQTGVPYSKES